MSLTVGGAPILELQLTMPEQGVWVADLEVDAEQLTGDVVVDDGEGNRFAGRVLRSDSLVGNLSAFVVGGKGGIGGGKVLEARHFRDVPARLVLADILRQTGEQLASSAQAGVLSVHLSAWSIVGGSAAGVAIKTLMRAAGGAWRVLADGTVWVGVDIYPAAPTFDHEELGRGDSEGSVLLGVDAFTLRPGVMLDGRKVGRVEHRFSGPEMRTTYHHG